jgi:hypothetical protein
MWKELKGVTVRIDDKGKSAVKRLPKHIPVRRLDLGTTPVPQFLALAAKDPGHRESLSYVEELEGWGIVRLLADEHVYWR